MKTKKHVSILCFMLCFVFLLASCSQPTLSTDENTTSKEISEESSKLEESKDEEDNIDEESSDALSEVELGYEAEMTEEMANAFLKFIGKDETVSEIVERSKTDKYPEGYIYKDDYRAIGNLNGYTFCRISNDFGIHITPETLITSWFSNYFVDGYDFTTSLHGAGKSVVGLYLYKENTFITFEDACEQGLIDVAEAYELFDAAGCSLKKLIVESQNNRQTNN